MSFKRILAVLFPAVLLLFCLCGCGDRNEQPILSLSDLHDRDMHIGMPSDYDVSSELAALCQSVEFDYYDDVLMGIQAVSTGKLDAYANAKNHFDAALSEDATLGIRVLDEPVKVFQIGLGLSASAPLENYVRQVNESIVRMRDDGVLDDMLRRWFVDGEYTMPEIRTPEHPDYTLRIVTYGKTKPYSYVQDGELAGFDVELAYRIAACLNCDITLEMAEYPAMLMGLSTGKYDMISANLFISAERAENILYSEPYDDMPISLIVRDEASGSSGTQTFWSDFADRFRSTFIAESRWKMVLSGFGVTLVLTVLGFALANVLGVGFCYLSMSGKKACRIIADVYYRIMQGTPMVVILMILFYVCFGKSTVSGIWIAVLSFGLASGATLARLFQGAIAGVDPGQREAALSLGFTRFAAFRGIVLPQAIRTMLTGYFGELIGLMKGTAIVGYVAVVDLTKVSDIIRSSTFDAFFPLLSVALIYFLTTFLLLSLLKRIQKRLAPKRRTREEVKP